MTAPQRPSRHWIRDPWPRTLESELAALRSAFPLWDVQHRADAADGYSFRAWRKRADGSQHGRLAHTGRQLGAAMATSEAEADLW
ncbi:hypothetical protein [Paractinoplanes maris]|uniref:hypothetical protein n=1 Tax=Paractinoplanes maris TaxID=1734446 RepID=UPI002020557E|nr:hypothetical protein [Actinoplanes maris]